MSLTTKQQRLETIAKQEAELKARKAALISQLSKEERKLDARRKIIVGGLILERAKTNQQLSDLLKEIVQQSVLKDQDKALLADLLGLPSSPILPTPESVPLVDNQVMQVSTPEANFAQPSHAEEPQS